MIANRRPIFRISVLCAPALLCVASFGQAQARPDLTDPAAILASLRPQPGATKRNAVTQSGASGWFNRSEYSLQITGVLSTSPGALTSKVQPGSLGFLLGARYHLNPWEALEFELGSTSGGAPYAAGTAAPVPTRINRFSLNEVLTSNSSGDIVPFLVVGGGIAQFEGSSADGSQSTSQIRPVGVLGVGMDLRVVHMGFRLEVEELFYRRPASGTPGAPSAWAHLSQPSAGVILTF